MGCIVLALRVEYAPAIPTHAIRQFQITGSPPVSAGLASWCTSAPIDQRGGKWGLNVVFSRATHPLAMVRSIRYHEFTKSHNGD